MASKLYGVDATIIIFVFVLYCIGLIFRIVMTTGSSLEKGRALTQMDEGIMKKTIISKDMYA